MGEGKQVHPPFQPDVEHVLLAGESAVGVAVRAEGVGVGGVYPHVAVAFEGIDFQSAAEVGEFRARHDAVVRGGFGLVHVIGDFPEDVEPRQRLVGHLRHHREVFEEKDLVARGAVHEVGFQGDLPEVEAVPQGDVVDEFVREVFHQVEGVDGAQFAVGAVPGEVVGVHVVPVCAERALAELQDELVFPSLEGVADIDAQLVAGDVVPELRREVEIDGGAVILVAADAHDQLACRKTPVVVGTVGEVHPVGGVEEALVGVHLVQTLAVGVREVLVQVAVEHDVQVFSPESGMRAYCLASDVFPLVIDPRFRLQFQ